MTTKPVAETVRRAAERINDYYVAAMLRAQRGGRAESSQEEIAEVAAVITTELATIQSTPADICAEMAREAESEQAIWSTNPELTSRYQAQADALREAERRIRAATVGGEAGCVWTVGDEVYGEPWETSCGNAFTLENDGSKENGMKFCCYCGKVLIEQERKS